MRVVVIAAVPRTRSVTAATGVLRAIMIVMANGGVLTNPFVAMPPLATIPVGATLRANAALRVPIFAADEPVTAVELLAGIATGCGDLESAILAEILAAIGYRRTHSGVADFAIAAVAIGTTFGTVAGLTSDAALQADTALLLEVFARLSLGDAQVRALAQRDALVVTAFLALATGAVTGAVVTEFAGATVRVVLAWIVAARFVATLAIRATAGSRQAVLTLVVFVANAARIADPAVLNDGTEMVDADTSPAFTRTGAVGIAAAIADDTPLAAVDLAGLTAATGNLNAGAERAVRSAGLAFPVTGRVAAHILRSETATAVFRRADDTIKEATSTATVADPWRCAAAR